MDSEDDTRFRVGCPIRTPRDQRALASPPGFSQRAASFIASQCQGIHQMPFVLARSQRVPAAARRSSARTRSKRLGTPPRTGASPPPRPAQMTPAPPRAPLGTRLGRSTTPVRGHSHEDTSRTVRHTRRRPGASRHHSPRPVPETVRLGHLSQIRFTLQSAPSLEPARRPDQPAANPGTILSSPNAAPRTDDRIPTAANRSTANSRSVSSVIRHLSSVLP
jgi:hypothetical protein